MTDEEFTDPHRALLHYHRTYLPCTVESFDSRGIPDEAAYPLEGTYTNGFQTDRCPNARAMRTRASSRKAFANGDESPDCTLTVAVRCRGLSASERNRTNATDILDVVEQKIVIVRDPDEGHKDYLDVKQNRTKEKQFTFDRAFGSSCTNRDVYEGTVKELVRNVVEGMNVTVFAYGATGSGKTYTMVGSPSDPGLMVRSLETIFDIAKEANSPGYEFKVVCSYLEIYNEIIYDLLVPSSGALDLREDPDLGIVVAGLKKIEVATPEAIMSLLNQGNGRRKTEATDANKTSSRSHAVLEIGVEKRQKNQYKSEVLRGKLCLVDLAGSERAKETNNTGKKLREGANINKSLLALANCINALGKAGLKQASYIPYRNSKLTRLLKDGLSGNSKTAMIANVACSSEQYSHSINTLKYADRAKEIKTHVSANVGTVDSHISEYKKMIDSLQQEVTDLQRKLAEAESSVHSSGGKQIAAESAELLENLAQHIQLSVKQQLDLQNKLKETEDSIVEDAVELETLKTLTQGIATNEVEYQEQQISELNKRLELKKMERKMLKQELDAYSSQVKDIDTQFKKMFPEKCDGNLVNLVSSYWIQSMNNERLEHQLAQKEGVISEQTQMITNMWNIILESDIGDKHLQVLSKHIPKGFNASGILLPNLEPSNQGKRPSKDGKLAEPISEQTGSAMQQKALNRDAAMNGDQENLPTCNQHADYCTPNKKARGNTKHIDRVFKDGSNHLSKGKQQSQKDIVPPSSTQKMKDEIQDLWREIRALKPQLSKFTFAEANGLPDKENHEQPIRYSKRVRSNRCSL